VKREIEIAAAVACGVLLVFGAGYIWDCRGSGGEVDKCWNTGEKTVTRALDILLGATGGFAVGYWTMNPSLRKEDQEAPLEPGTDPEGGPLPGPGDGSRPHPLSRNAHDSRAR
jgi:hypothetical protein